VISCFANTECRAMDNCWVVCDEVVRGICPFAVEDPPPICPHPY
jgi:hypothetical protein